MKALLMLGSTLFASGMMQPPSTPPVKMGLWESTLAVSMKLPAGAPSFLGNTPRTAVVKSCFTPESWAKNITASQQQQKSCERTHEVYSATGVSFDLTCNNGRSKGHVEMIFDSMEAMHGTAHMDEGTQGMTVDSKTASHFISADCGAVTPDKPVVSH